MKNMLTWHQSMSIFFCYGNISLILCSQNTLWHISRIMWFINRPVTQKRKRSNVLWQLLLPCIFAEVQTTSVIWYAFFRLSTSKAENYTELIFTDAPAAMAFTPPTTTSPMLQQIQNETIGKKYEAEFALFTLTIV